MTQVSPNSPLAHRAIAWLGAVSLASAALSCQSVAPPTNSNAAEPRIPQGLLSTERLRRESFTLRHHLRFSFGDRSSAVEAVLQKTCDTVEVVGLGPLGTRLFALSQSGRDIRYEPAEEEAWPFSPRRILIDIQRIYLYPLQDPPPSDGIHETNVSGVRVAEHWKSGRLWKRILATPSGERRERVIIRYRGGLARGEAPPPVELADEIRKYRLEIETVSFTQSECP